MAADAQSLTCCLCGCELKENPDGTDCLTATRPENATQIIAVHVCNECHHEMRRKIALVDRIKARIREQS